MTFGICLRPAESSCKILPYLVCRHAHSFVIPDGVERSAATSRDPGDRALAWISQT